MDLSKSKLKTFLKASVMSPERRDYLIGIALLLVVVLEWTGSGFLTQGLFDEGFEKPFLVTYLNTSAFSFYLLPFLFRYWRECRRETGDQSLPESRGLYNPVPLGPSVDVPSSYVTPFLANESLIAPEAGLSHATPELPPLTTRETAHLASLFCFFWFVANWTVNASLDYTSVASSTILSSMSGFFTLGVGKLFGVESFSLGKLGAVLMSMLGVLLVSLEDSVVSSSRTLSNTFPSASAATNSSAVAVHLFARSSSLASVPLVKTVTHPSTSNPILGDCLALLSAVFYALYVTLLKVRIKTESRVNMQLFFGFVGIVNVVTLWPVGVILHFMEIETFEWPRTNAMWTIIWINMFITLSSDYIYLLAMLKTTPLLATVGLSLTIPFAVVGDWTLLRIPASWQALLGASLVLGSFVALGIEGSAASESDGGIDRRGYEGLDAVGLDLEDEAPNDERGRSVVRTKSLRGSPAVMTTTEGSSALGPVSQSPGANIDGRGAAYA